MGASMKAPGFHDGNGTERLRLPNRTLEDPLALSAPSPVGMITALPERPASRGSWTARPAATNERDPVLNGHGC